MWTFSELYSYLLNGDNDILIWNILFHVHKGISVYAQFGHYHICSRAICSSNVYSWVMFTKGLYILHYDKRIRQWVSLPSYDTYQICLSLTNELNFDECLVLPNQLKQVNSTNMRSQPRSHSNLCRVSHFFLWWKLLIYHCLLVMWTYGRPASLKMLKMTSS